MQPPNPAEYRPFFQRYIDLVPPGGITDVLKQQAKDATAFFAALPPANTITVMPMANGASNKC